MASPFNTIRRAGKLAKIAAAARQAARLDGVAKERARELLASLMADAKGLPMKVGQFMASQAGGEAFTPLTQTIDPLPLAVLLPQITKTLGKPVAEVFASIAESGTAASLGQVHRAVTLGGEAVAIKVQYPDIASAVAAEMTLLGLLPGIGPVKRRGIDLTAYKAMLRANLMLELDYTSEADRQRRFADAVHVRGLRVPRVLPGLGGIDLLVQTWEDGQRLETATTWPDADRSDVARILLQTLLTSLFAAGTIHGDPHPGNYLVRRTADGRPEVVLLDYGCIVTLSETSRLALLTLILASRGESDVVPGDAFAAMGFDMAKLAPINDQLPALCQILFEPFVTDRPFRLQDWQLGERIGQLLGDERWCFRAAGPPEMVLLIRAFQGLMTHLERLQVGLAWWPHLVEALGPALLVRARTNRP